MLPLFSFLQLYVYVLIEYDLFIQLLGMLEKHSMLSNMLEDFVKEVK